MSLNTNDLDWTAFCYVAGELSPHDVEQFEARLAVEQPAREALARAAEMTQAVAAAESQVDDVVVSPAARQRTSWITRVSWMTVGGVAAALMALLWSGALRPGGKAQLAGAHLLAQSELATAWTLARDEMAAAKEAGQWPTVVTSADADDEPLPAAETRGDDLALETPTWMTTAVLGLAGMSATDVEGGAGPFHNGRGDN